MVKSAVYMLVVLLGSAAALVLTGVMHYQEPPVELFVRSVPELLESSTYPVEFDKEETVFLFFTDIAGSCRFVEELKKLHDFNNVNTSVYIVVDDSYTRADVLNLKAALEIRVEILILGKRASKAWIAAAIDGASRDHGNSGSYFDGSAIVFKNSGDVKSAGRATLRSLDDIKALLAKV